MSFVSRKYGQFAYFDQQLDHPPWAERTVLDFGGNAGNLLDDASEAVDHRRYYCIDVSRAAIEVGRQRYPDAHWVFYDRYSYGFNPAGVPSLAIPDLGVDFDVVLAYSVFTHTGLDELLEIVPELMRRLRPGGALAFTFIDPHFHSWPETARGSNLRYRLERIREGHPGVDVEAMLTRAGAAERCVLVDDEALWLDEDPVLSPSPGSTGPHHVFYTASFVQALFPRASIRAPANREMQHCCILRSGRG